MVAGVHHGISMLLSGHTVGHMQEGGKSQRSVAMARLPTNAPMMKSQMLTNTVFLFGVMVASVLIVNAVSSSLVCVSLFSILVVGSSVVCIKLFICYNMCFVGNNYLY